jgi:hypothetical protein
MFLLHFWIMDALSLAAPTHHRAHRKPEVIPDPHEKARFQ